MNARALNLLGLGLVGVVGVAFLVLVPRLFELDVVLELTVYMIMAILALSLALIWGYGGILCFGQSAFFGLGAYTYAIAVFNIGESTVPLLLAIALPAAFAALLGYFMFYGRISDVYLGVITLTVTLILFNSINSDRRPGIPHRRRRGSAASTAFPAFRRSICRATRPRRSISRACSILRPPRCSRPISACGCCSPAGSAASSSASARTNGAPNCWATIRAAYKLAIFTIGGALAGLCRLPVRQLGQFRQPDDLRPRAIRADHHLGDRRRARHADRSDRRLHRHPVAHHRARRQPAERRLGLVGQDLCQCAADPRHHPDRVRAAGAERAGADARRSRPMAAVFARQAAPRRGWSPSGRRRADGRAAA